MRVALVDFGQQFAKARAGQLAGEPVDHGVGRRQPAQGFFRDRVERHGRLEHLDRLGRLEIGQQQIGPRPVSRGQLRV